MNDGREAADGADLARSVLEHFAAVFKQAEERNELARPRRAQGVLVFISKNRDYFHVLPAVGGTIEKQGHRLRITFSIEDPDNGNR